MPMPQIPGVVEIDGAPGRLLALITEADSPAECIVCDRPGLIRITDALGTVHPWCRACLLLQQGPSNPDTYYRLVRV